MNNKESRNLYYYGIDNNRGGMENFALNLLKGIRNKRDDLNINIITEFDDFAFKEIFLNRLKCNYFSTPRKNKHPLQYKKSLKKIFKSINENDIFVCSLMSYRNFVLLKEISKLKCKVFIIGHSSGNKKINLFHSFFRMKYVNLGTKIAPTDAIARFMFLNRDCIIIPNGIQSKKFAFNNEYRSSIRKQLEVSDQTFLVGHIGRISYLKNQKFTSKLTNLVPDKYHFLFLGKLQDEKQINDINISNSTILNETIDVNKYYSALDVLVVPSIHEGQPYVALEASANGLPVLCSVNVPHIDGLNNIKYLELIEKDWLRSLSDMRINCSPRDNLLIGTPYEIKNSVNRYIEIFNI